MDRPTRYKSKKREIFFGLVAQGLTPEEACSEMGGVAVRTAARWRAELKNTPALIHENDFTPSAIHSQERTVDEIIAAKRAKFARLKKHYDSSGEHTVKINIDGPIGIAHFGDPHLDDDGCDIDLFFEHMELVKKTPALFAGNIGDVLNNWVGRLVRKYAEQTTTQAEGWRLFEKIFSEMRWLYVVYGNHDCWTGSNDPGRYIMKAFGQQYVNHGTRIRLEFPNGEHMMVNVSHDYKGHSEVNSMHGAMKKAIKFGDDLYVCGHRHHTAASMFMHQATKKPVRTIRLDSYKRYDDYPGILGIDETFGSPCIVTIMNPYAENPFNRVMVFEDPVEGARYLTDLRKRWAAQ